MEGQLLDMVKFPLYFEYMDGVVGRIFAIESDSVFCTNIKKGIVSLFQIQAEPGERTEVNVSGLCNTMLLSYNNFLYFLSVTYFLEKRLILGFKWFKSLNE